MRRGRVDRAPYPAGPVHLPADALFIRQLSSGGGTVRFVRPVRIHALGGHEPGPLGQDHHLGVGQRMAASRSQGTTIQARERRFRRGSFGFGVEITVDFVLRPLQQQLLFGQELHQRQRLRDGRTRNLLHRRLWRIFANV